MTGQFGLAFILTIVWSLVSILAPFFLYGTWYRSKQIDIKLEETNFLLRRLVSASNQLNQSSHEQPRKSKSETTTESVPPVPDGYILASEFASKHNLSIDDVIDKITQKKIEGKPINGLWHVYAPDFS